jgi:hypothetical protein
MANASVVGTANWNAAFCTANYHRDWATLRTRSTKTPRPC